MTSGLGFYLKPKVLESTSFDDDELFANEEEDDDFDNQGYLQEVPYTSSSVDRSSIGSIPWADDAIKLNQVEWERVEKMLNGEEPLTDIEDDLRNELLDWQKKFPKLLNHTKYKMKNLSSETLDIESLPSLELSSEEENDAEDKITLTRENSRKRSSEDLSTTPTPSIRKSSEDSSNLCQLLDNFTLTSVPLTLKQRESTIKPINRRKCASSSSSYSIRTPPTPIQVPSVTTTNTNRFRMPPILNVLETRRKFRSVAQNKNPSFVQLTQIQQAKSAVVTKDQTVRSRFHTGHRSAWHVPLAANRFFNNRNSIILPAISTRHHQAIHQYTTQPTTTSTSSEMGTSNTTPSSGVRENLLRTNINSFTNNIPTRREFVLRGFSKTPSTQTNTSTSGRSISAAVQYPRATFNALYLPYSALKFQAFK